jgi:hypothetical protein
VIYGDTAIIDSEGNSVGLRRLRPPKELSWKSFADGMLVCHQAFFANVVPLGGAADDHPGPSSWRDYSFGSGFNLKSSSRLTIGSIGRIWLDVEDHHLYTWLGYDGMESHNRTYAQGHRGHKEVLMVRSAAEVNMRSGWGLRLAASYFYRNNRYAVLPNRKAHAWEWRAGVMWRL